MLLADAMHPYDLGGPFDQLHPCYKGCNTLESKDRSPETDFDMREQNLPKTAGKGMALKIFILFLLFLNLVSSASYRPSPFGVNESPSLPISVDLRPLGGQRIITGCVITGDDVILLPEVMDVLNFLQCRT